MDRAMSSIGAFAIVTLGCLGGLLEPAAAQNYPAQPIKIIVATPPGGIADLVGRTFAQKLSEGGKTAVVENRTGAGGAIAAEAAAKAAPDGYTLYVSMHQTNAILPHLVSKLSVRSAQGLRADPQRDRVVQHSGRPPVHSRQDGEGVGRLRQGQSRQADLRLAGQRQLRSRGRRTVQAACRHRHCPRALSRRRAGQSGPGRRPRLDDVRHRAAGAHADRGRQDTRPRGRLAAAARRDARRADHGGSRISADRGRPLVRPGGAGRDAARHHRLAQRRGPQGIFGTGRARPLSRAGHPAAARHAGTVRRLHRRPNTNAGARSSRASVFASSRMVAPRRSAVIPA